jgi:hypothetical protein
MKITQAALTVCALLGAKHPLFIVQQSMNNALLLYYNNEQLQQGDFVYTNQQMCVTVTSRIASEYQQMRVWLSVSLSGRLCNGSI